MTQASPRASTATRLVVSARRSGARSAPTRPERGGQVVVRVGADGRPGRLQRPQHVVEVVAAGVTSRSSNRAAAGGPSTTAYASRSACGERGPLDQGVEQGVGVGAAVEAAGVVREQLVAAVVVGVAQRVAGLSSAPSARR